MGRRKSAGLGNHTALDVISLAFAVLVIAGVSVSSARFLPSDADVLMPITERLGTTAGLVSALSLAGLTFAGTGGKAKLIFDRFSKTLAIFFASSYFVVVLLALLCALAPAWELHPRFLSWVIGTTLGCMVVLVGSTTFVLFGLLHQSSLDPEEDSKQAPPPEY